MCKRAADTPIANVMECAHWGIWIVKDTPPAQNIICNKGDWSEEEKSFGKAVSNELFFSVQNNKIIMDNIDGGYFFDIYNSIGERVIHGCANNEIDISFLRKGLYIIRLSHNNEIISTYKFVK